MTNAAATTATRTAKTTATRIQDATNRLAKAGITFVLTTTNRSSGDAYETAAATHGDRLAHVHMTGGSWVDGGISHLDWTNQRTTATRIQINFDYRHPGDATTIVKAFNQAGLTATWTGYDDDAVTADLA